jgi:hypothetical protein
MGAPYYGTVVRLGAGGQVALDDAWVLEAAAELPLGPGDNVIDRDGRFGRTPTWRAGVRWRATPRVVLDGRLTNAAGVTPVTRHLTMPGDARVLYGVGVRYTPSAPEPPATGVHTTGGAAVGGATIPPFATLAPASGRVEGALDTRGAWGLHVRHALGRRFQIEVLATRLDGPDAPAIMEADLGSSWEYRVAATLGLADEAEGAPLSWAHRVSVGRDWDDQQGYLLAEVIAARGLGPALTLIANPLAIHSGGRSPVSVGVGARRALGPLTALPEWRGSLTGESPVWSLGIELPGRVLGLSALDARLLVTNAAGLHELGRVLADPRGAKLGVAVGIGF